MENIFMFCASVYFFSLLPLKQYWRSCQDLAKDLISKKCDAISFFRVVESAKLPPNKEKRYVKMTQDKHRALKQNLLLNSYNFEITSKSDYICPSHFLVFMSFSACWYNHKEMYTGYWSYLLILQNSLILKRQLHD